MRVLALFILLLSLLFIIGSFFYEVLAVYGTIVLAVAIVISMNIVKMSFKERRME